MGKRLFQYIVCVVAVLTCLAANCIQAKREGLDCLPSLDPIMISQHKEMVCVYYITIKAESQYQKYNF